MIYKIPYRSFSGDKILAFFLAFGMHSPALGVPFLADCGMILARLLARSSPLLVCSIREHPTHMPDDIF